jgi:hypothetical protein
MSSNFQALIKEIIQQSSIVPELNLFNVLTYNERLQYFFITEKRLCIPTIMWTVDSHVQ